MDSVPYTVFRGLAISTTRASAGVSQPSRESPDWGVLMETRLPNAVFALLCLSDGTASLYMGTGAAGKNRDALRNILVQEKWSRSKINL
jgi:hypothetical protein